MRTIRNSLALLLASLAASAQGDGEPAIRRAAALIDYVARGYGAAVVDGAVVNPVEYEEQQAFAQEAAELLERQPAVEAFAVETRALEAAVRARAPAGAVAAQALSIDRRLLESAGLATTPPPGLQAALGPVHYEQSCTACHGTGGRGDGFAARTLSTPPPAFTGPERDALTPYRVYSAITWGVPRTAMPAFDSLSEQRRWLLALHVLTFGHSEGDAQKGEALARARGLVEQGPALVARSDAELRADFTARGLAPPEVRALLAWVRRIAPFAAPPPSAFPELREQLSIATSSYVHGDLAEAQRRLRAAERDRWAALEPLVRAASPLKVGPVREAFARARAQMAAPGANTRVLGATALLSRRIADAGLAPAPGPRVLRAAGAGAALRQGWPAALVLLASLLAALQAAAPRAEQPGPLPLAARASAPRAAGYVACVLLAAVAGPLPGLALAAAAPASVAFRAGAVALAAVAVALAPLHARGLRALAIAAGAGAAALAALACAAAAAQTAAAAAALFPLSGSELPRAAALTAAALAALALLAAAALRKPPLLARLAGPFAVAAAAALYLR